MFNSFKKKFNAEKVVKAFNKRKKYASITEQLIDTLDDDALLQAMYDYVDLQVQFNAKANVYEQFCQLPVGIQNIFAIYYFELAEESDGLNCFFDYDYGLFAEELIRAFSVINAHISERLIRDCINVEFQSLENYKIIRNDYFKYISNRSYNNELYELEKNYKYHIDYSEKTLVKYIRDNTELFLAD